MPEYVRIIPELRAAHLERVKAWGQSELVLYHKLSWDLIGETNLPHNVARMRFRSVKTIASRSNLTVELPEPLWIRESPRTVAAALVFTLLGRGRVKFVTYAIENNDTPSLIGLGAFTTPALKILSKLYGRFLSRIAFGSDGAKTAYSKLLRLDKVDSEVFIELPTRKSEETTAVARPRTALFVGRLESRKGVLELLRAWEILEEADSSCRLTIVGTGPLESDISAWVAANATQRQFKGGIEHQQLDETYRTHSILIAPSKREGRWREQIGLPIKEALAHGLTVVTTRETGLSLWLQHNGHPVLTRLNVHEMAEVLHRALSEPIDRTKVLQSLPPIDGREKADQWLKQLNR